MGTFLKIIVREGITKRVAGEVFEHLTAPSASLTSVGHSSLGSTKVALDPTKRNNPEIKKIYQSNLQKSSTFESFLLIYTLTQLHTHRHFGHRMGQPACNKEGKVMPKLGDVGKCFTNRVRAF